MDKYLLITDLRKDEGVKAFPYRDSLGKLTIGIGRNLDEVGLSDDEINYLVSNDIDRVEAQLDRLLPWWNAMTEPRQRVLANMCFNVGINRLLGFKKALTAMQAERYTEAAKEMLDSLWARQVGNRAKRLAQMMIDG